MRMSTVFMLGTISGAVVVGLWRRELRAYGAETSRRIRAKAANGMPAVEKTGTLADSTGSSLRHAEELLHVRAAPAAGEV